MEAVAPFFHFQLMWVGILDVNYLGRYASTTLAALGYCLTACCIAAFDVFFL